MQHRNAPLTPNGRRRLVALVEEDGLTFEAAAAASNVARSTCWEWVRRWREAGVPAAILKYRGQMHGFWSYAGVSDISRVVNRDILTCLSLTLRRVP